MSRTDQIADWLVSNGVPVDIPLTATPAPVWLIYPLAKRWWIKENKLKPLDYYINLVTDEQRWEEPEVPAGILDFYPVVQIRHTKIIGVVKAEVDGEFLIHYERGGLKQYITVPYPDLYVLDGIRIGGEYER